MQINIGGLMSGGRMSGGWLSGGLMSGGLMSAHRTEGCSGQQGVWKRKRLRAGQTSSREDTRHWNTMTERMVTNYFLFNLYYCDKISPFDAHKWQQIVLCDSYYCTMFRFLKLNNFKLAQKHGTNTVQKNMFVRTRVDILLGNAENASLLHAA